MSTVAQFHIKKDVATRAIVCGTCVLPSDEHLGFSFSARPCSRCQKPIDAGIVVQGPKQIKRSKK